MAAIDTLVVALCDAKVLEWVLKEFGFIAGVLVCLKISEKEVKNLGKYNAIIAPGLEKKGGIIEAFHALQSQYNFIPEDALPEVAKTFGVSEAQAYGVATFYSYLSTKPRGKYIIRMCESAPCHVAGAGEVLQAFEAELGVKVGDTTEDGKFTLELTQCIGQCQETPAISINSVPMTGVKPEMVPTIIAQCK
jgi:NADH-quinone oxidoreductase subunit E